MSVFIQKIISFFTTILIFLGLMKPTPVQPVDPDPDPPVYYMSVADNAEDLLATGIIAPTGIPDDTEIERIKKLLVDDKNGGFFFSDIDYNNLDNFRPRNHLNRLYYFAYKAKNSNGNERAECADICVKLVNNWVNNNYKSTNWWYNEIYTPDMLISSLYLMDNFLSSETKKAVLSIVENGVFTKNESTKSNTGANCLDTAAISILYGGFVNDADTVEYSVNRVQKELTFSDYEGMKSDYSFFQHGNRIYMGAYGIDFVGSVADIAAILNGTKYSFSKSTLQPLCDYILKGLGTVCYGNKIDPTVIGRSVSRNAPDESEKLAGYLKLLVSNSEIGCKNDIRELISSIENNTKSDKGVHYFDIAKFIVINNSDFYFSWRGGDNKLYYGESINNENILAYNTSYPGVTTIMSDGKALNHLSAIRDYSLFPGTTAVYESDSELSEHINWNNRKLTGTYLDYNKAGIVISSAKTTHESIDMTVSCFATDNSAVLLGSGLKNAEGKEMITTIQQCNYAGTHTFDGKNIVHSGIKYSILQGGEAHVYTQQQRGNYKRNNLSENSTMYSGEVFFATLNNNGSYAYSVMGENTNDNYIVIENNEAIQAVVLPNGKIAAVFYEPGSFDYGGKTYISETAAALVF